MRGIPVSEARCACGALRLKTSRPPELTALCHCFACQRRTGAAFSANAFYAVEAVEISGDSNEFVRTGDSGGEVRMRFCPACGTTLYRTADASPSWVGVGVGCFADPRFPAPDVSVFEHARMRG